MRLPALRSRLLLLAFGSMVPLLGLSLLLAALLWQREQALVRDGAMDRCRAIASAVDAQLDGHFAALRSLAAGGALEAGDLTTFLATARHVRDVQPHWRNLLLVDRTGQQRLNLRFDLHASLPHEPPDVQAELQAAFDSGQPTVANLGPGGPVSRQVGVLLRMRVPVGGQPMVLMLVLDPQAFTALLASQALPATWAAAVVDGNGRFVARLPHRPPGDAAAPGLRQAVQQAREGWLRARSLEGVDMHQAFVHTARSPWAVAVAIPRAEVVAAGRGAAWWLGLGTLASLALAGALALVMARAVSQPMRALARAAREVGQGDDTALVGPLREPGFAEAQAVAQALDEAAATAREREALQAREQEALREADRAKNEFIAMLGHELRNPLGAITTAVQVLRRAPPEASQAKRVQEVIERQARQMSRLVDDLVDLSRLATGKLRLQRGVVDLLPVLRQAVQAWQQAGAFPDMVVQLHVAQAPGHGATAWVHVDRARIEQVVVNLLDNAAKFSAGSGTVDLTLRREGGQAHIEVQDHGRGVAAADLPHVFEAFYQAPQSPHRPQGGLGLGLAVVRRLVELHGGQVTVASAGEGRGATFTVALPLADAPVPLPDVAVPTTPSAGRRVLVVEDNDDARAMLALHLQLDGHDVRTAATGQAALDIAAQWPPEVALVDIGLPDLTGHEVARRLKAMGHRPAPRLVAVSGFCQPEDRQRSLEAGFELHLTKPVSAEVLRGVVG